MIKLGAKDLRTTFVSEEEKKQIKRNPIYIICDNVIDTYNIGSIFRLADAVGASKVYLCGVSETPPNTRIKKASINTTEWVEWEYFGKTEDAIADLRKQFSTRPSDFLEQYSSSEGENRPSREVRSGIQIVAVEQSSESVHFQKAEYSLPIAFVVGNETTGSPKEVLDLCDQTVEIPMWGVNKSLNVMVSLGIVLFNVMPKLVAL